MAETRSITYAITRTVNGFAASNFQPASTCTSLWLTIKWINDPANPSLEDSGNGLTASVIVKP
jgi:hypothetical protein